MHAYLLCIRFPPVNVLRCIHRFIVADCKLKVFHNVLYFTNKGNWIKLTSCKRDSKWLQSLFVIAQDKNSRPRIPNFKKWLCVLTVFINNTIYIFKSVRRSGFLIKSNVYWKILIPQNSCCVMSNISSL